MWSLIYKIGIRQLAYIALAGTRATIIWIVFNLCTITLFYSNVIFYLAEDAITGFILSNLQRFFSEGSSSRVISMNVHVLNHLRGVKSTATSCFSGSSMCSL